MLSRILLVAEDGRPLLVTCTNCGSPTLNVDTGVCSKCYLLGVHSNIQEEPSTYKDESDEWEVVI